MLYQKHLLILMAVILLASADFSPISYDENGVSAINIRNVRKVDPIQASRDIVKTVDFAKLFKTLRRNRSMEEVRLVGTLGLLSGALKVEESMRENLYQLSDELLDSFNKSTPKENMKKLIEIEETINRDKSVVQMLNGMLKYARNVTTLEDFRNEMQSIRKENDATSKRLRSKKLAIDKEVDASASRKSATTGKLMDSSGSNMKYKIKERLYDVRDMIDNHVDDIHSSVTESVKQTIKYIQNVQKHNKKVGKPAINHAQVKLDPSLNAVRRLWDQVASPDSSETFDVEINYRPDIPEIRQGMRSIEMARLTKGEEAEISTTSPMNMILVDPKLERFKRQFGYDLGPYAAYETLGTFGTYGNFGQDTTFSVDIDMGLDDDRIKSRKDDGVDDEENNEKNENKENNVNNEINENNEDNEIEGNGDEEHKNEPQDEFDSSSAPEQPAGLVGLITNLSGGADGSDVGAVIGALSQVLSNLLGPGGIDIPGLVGSGSALLASLIAGDENFGKVLGNIVGLAVDGFSGGGGAANNGQFFGQFIGKLISSLSADAEDDDAPLQPDVFVENFYDGIGKGAAKEVESTEASTEKPEGGGSDSSAFIKSLLSGVFNVFAKASGASSAGSSQGSAQASTSSSGSSSQGSAQASTGSSGSSSQGSAQASTSASGASSKGSSGHSSGGTSDAADTESIRK